MLTVQAKEGLPIGMAITVRYHLDAGRLVYIHSTLPAESIARWCNGHRQHLPQDRSQLHGARGLRRQA